MKAIKKPVIVNVMGPLLAPMIVITAHGDVQADTGDYVIEDPETADRWPIKAAIFNATYTVLK